MATRKPRAVPAVETVAAAATEAAAPAPVLATVEDTIALIKMGMMSEQKFAFIPMDAICDKLVTDGVIEINPQITKTDTTPPQVAARIKETTMTAATDTTTQAPTATPTAAAAATVAARRTFEIETVEIPEDTRRPRQGTTRGELYPFSKLEAGQGFFIQPKEGQTQAELFEALSSTISAANARYAEPHPEGGTMIKRGKEVPRTVQTRTFGRMLRTKDGIEGVHVFRKVETAA